MNPIGKKLRLLVAEDSEDEILIFKTVAQRCAPVESVRFIQSGTEAIDYLAGREAFADRAAFPFPNLLVLDLNMPGAVNGFGVLEWLKAHPECSVVPTLVFSSSPDPRDVQRAYRLGANGYVMKPHRLAEFSEALEAIARFWVLCEWPEPPAELRCSA